MLSYEAFYWTDSQCVVFTCTVIIIVLKLHLIKMKKDRGGDGISLKGEYLPQCAMFVRALTAYLMEMDDEIMMVGHRVRQWELAD